MTLLEAAKQALDVLRSEYSIKGTNKYNPWDTIKVLSQAIQQSALDQIAENERELGIGLQEPVAWVGLTDDEITELRLKNNDAVATNYDAYKAIEAKLKEKNA